MTRLGTGPVFDRARNAIAFIVTILLLLTLLSVAANAQDSTPTPQEPQRWYIFADTAGIVPVDGLPDTYMTWVFAKATPTAFPSSGILVAWNCRERLVKRLVQVKYSMNSDSTVTGPIQEVNGPWQPVMDERLYQLVCSIGPTHVYADNAPPTKNPLWLAPGVPRTDA